MQFYILHPALFPPPPPPVKYIATTGLLQIIGKAKVYLHWVRPVWSIMASFMLHVVDKYAWNFYIENANF